MSLPSSNIPYYPPEKWMSYIPNTIHLNKLRIPGTHNSGTGGNPSKKFLNISKAANFAARCHTLDIASQLRRGIRYIDVRLKLEKDGELNVYHKIVQYDVTFSGILNAISDFLKENTKECIMIRLHREDGDPGGKYRRNDISDKMFVDALVSKLREFEDKERRIRISEREGNIMSQNSNHNENDDESLNAIYNKENNNPLLGEVRRKIILFGVRHVADVELLSESPFKFRSINKQAEFKLKCNDSDIEKKKSAIIEGFKTSMSDDFSNSLFVNEINAIGSFPFLSFIPYPQKMAEIMNNITESILIQLFNDKTTSNNHSNNEFQNNHTNLLRNNENNSSINENQEENNNISISDPNQITNNNYENDFQGVLLFDFPEISKGGNLIELTYAQNFI